MRNNAALGLGVVVVLLGAVSCWGQNFNKYNYNRWARGGKSSCHENEPCSSNGQCCEGYACYSESKYNDGVCQPIKVYSSVATKGRCDDSSDCAPGFCCQYIRRGRMSRIQLCEKIRDWSRCVTKKSRLSEKAIFNSIFE